MLDNMMYNRSERVYEVAGDEGTETFPAGRDGRREAFKYAVYCQNPRLFQFTAELVKEHPVLEARAWKAAEIVLSEGVMLRDNGVLATVASQSSEYGDYLIQAVNQVLTCDCEDYSSLTAPFINEEPQPWCKHLIAYRLALRLEKRTCYHCHQLVDADLMTCPECGQDVTPF